MNPLRADPDAFGALLPLRLPDGVDLTQVLAGLTNDVHLSACVRPALGGPSMEIVGQSLAGLGER